jgi:translocator protein
MLRSDALEGCVFNNQGQFKVRYSRRTELLALAGFLFLCLGVGLSGSGVSALNLHNWYLTLNPPELLPPVWVFPPVWIVLYFMIGVAGWEIWRVPDVAMRNHRALTVWGWQIGLKALWTPVFFGLHWLLPALGVGCALFGTAMFTLLRFSRLNRAAALLMLPYCGWLTFELYLNAGFWWLNR